MKYLGIDYGLKKVGLAISEGQVASPLKVVSISSLADAVAKIKHEIGKEEIQRVVIGVPESNTSQKIVKKFIAELKGEYRDRPVEIIETPETLSSNDAQDLMITLGTSKKDREKEDAYSAMLILQQFLDTLS